MIHNKDIWVCWECSLPWIWIEKYLRLYLEVFLLYWNRCRFYSCWVRLHQVIFTFSAWKFLPSYQLQELWNAKSCCQMFYSQWKSNAGKKYTQCPCIYFFYYYYFKWISVFQILLFPIKPLWPPSYHRNSDVPQCNYLFSLTVKLYHSENKV